MTFIIKHQAQPCPVSCVSTCIAMIADCPAAEIIELFHKDYREGDLSIGEMLKRLNIHYTSFDTAGRQSLDNDGIYLCSVPSLNIRGGMHQVIVEMLDGEWTVLDPNLGRDDDRMYYSAQPNDPSFPKSVMLGSGYSVDALISHQALSYWRKHRTGARA